MQKRGFIALETLIEMIPKAAIFFFLLVFLGGLFAIYLNSDSSQSGQDLDRLVENINKLSPQETLSVPILTGDDAQFVFYSRDLANLPSKCKGQSCLCVHEFIDGKQITKCELFPAVTQKCSVDKCDKKDLCFKGIAQSKRNLDGAIVICRSCTQFGFAKDKEECQRLLS